MKRTLSDKALAVVAAYKDMPYYNNKRQGMRMALRARVGKGSPEEIADEALTYALQEKINLNEFAPDMRKKFLVDHHLGIDCSGFAYHVLTAEAEARGLGSLSKSLSFPFANSLLARLGRALGGRKVENADVRTFADPSNSHIVKHEDAQPGDFTVLVAPKESGIHNHMKVVVSVTHGEGGMTEVEIAHSIALPEEGKYGHGVRLETLPLAELKWPLHRLNWL